MYRRIEIKTIPTWKSHSSSSSYQKKILTDWNRRGQGGVHVPYPPGAVHDTCAGLRTPVRQVPEEEVPHDRNWPALLCCWPLDHRAFANIWRSHWKVCLDLRSLKLMRAYIFDSFMKFCRFCDFQLSWDKHRWLTTDWSWICLDTCAHVSSSHLLRRVRIILLNLVS